MSTSRRIPFVILHWRIVKKKLLNRLKELLQKTYRLSGATQLHICLQRLVLFAACAKPGLCIIHSSSHSPILAKTRVRKVRAWVARTMVSMETDGLDIVRCRSAEGKLNRVLLKATERTGSTFEETTGIRLCTDTFVVGGGADVNFTKEERKGDTYFLLVSRLLIRIPLMEQNI